MQPQVLITLCAPPALHGALARNQECQPQIPSLATLSRTQTLTLQTFMEPKLSFIDSSSRLHKAFFVNPIKLLLSANTFPFHVAILCQQSRNQDPLLGLVTPISVAQVPCHSGTTGLFLQS